MAQAQSIIRRIERIQPGETEPLAIDQTLGGRAKDRLYDQFDSEHGGFGAAPRFPPDTSLDLLLDEHGRSVNVDALDVAQVTLRKMAPGGNYDHLAGGFHRYAGALIVQRKSTRDGVLPSGNAVAAHNLLTLYGLTKRPRYRQRASHIIANFTHAMATNPAAVSLSAQVVTASATVSREASGPFQLSINLSIEDGWHTNAARITNALLIPTSVEVDGDGMLAEHRLSGVGIVCPSLC
ncbi:TPA: hypothetical protein DCE37_11650 [Candidatus Latescibacteria bacterium]|nr:hypothetical protein [Candidatus Latescibacterota bacterium]